MHQDQDSGSSSSHSKSSGSASSQSQKKGESEGFHSEMVSEEEKKKSMSTNRQQSMMIRRDSAGKVRKPVYHTLNIGDVRSSYLRVAIEGTTARVRSSFKELKIECGENEDDFNNVVILAFFLSVQNQKVETAHFLLKCYRRLRKVLTYLLQNKDSSESSQQRNDEDSDSIFQSQRDPNSKEVGKSGLSNDRNDQNSNLLAMQLILVGNDGSDRGIPVKMKGQQNRTNSMNKTFRSGMDMDEGPESSRYYHSSYKSSMKYSDGQEQNRQLTINKSLGTLPENHHANNANLIKLKTLEDLKRIKALFKSEIGSKLVARVVKVALNLKEDMVAAMIVARYDFDLEDSIVNYAIAEKQLTFLHNVFYYEKHLIIDYEDEEGDVIARYLNFEMIIEKVSTYCYNSEVENVLACILDWKFTTEENILKILVDLELEHLAAKYMFQYPQYANFNFFFYCLTYIKDIFLKHALKKSYFDQDYCYDPRVISWSLQQMKEGEKFLFTMNVLLYTDFRKWNISSISELVNIGSNIIYKNIETNYLLITYNPILALAIYVEYMKEIIAHFNVFDAQCKIIVERIKKLGKIIIENMVFEQVEEVFMEKDFKNRTVLAIICQNDLKSFIVRQKLRFLLNKIWDGKDSNLIDGKTSHFSKTLYLINHQPRQLMGAKTEFSEIFGKNFKRYTKHHNFSFQLKFRKQSIEIIYLKDFMCAAILIVIFQYINYLYLSLFSEREYKDLPTEEEQLNKITENLAEYSSINFLGILLSLSYFVSLFCRIVFNTFSQVRLPLDLWMIFDLVTGTINIGAFTMIGNAQADTIYDSNTKRFFDYYIIVILIFSWIRFFSYFLVVDTIGKITITLLRMILETIYFLFIVITYLLLMTTIFTTLFRNTNSVDESVEYFSSIFFTLRLLFDYTTGNFGIIEMGNYYNSFGLLYIVHTVISNIFLLNYLVAILQTAQQIMFANGDFYSIKYQYIFIAKYMTALEEKNGYDELILLPPPLNIMLVPLILVAPFPKLMKKASQFFKQMIFWGENILLVLGYFIYFLFLAPYIYFKKTFLIITKLKGFGIIFFYAMGWLITGPFYLLYINLLDLKALIHILCLKQNDTRDLNQEDKHRYDVYSLVIYKDVNSALKQLYDIASGSVNVLKHRNTMNNILSKKMTFSQRIKQQEVPVDNKVEDVFLVSRELVFEVYKEISRSNKITRYYRGILSKKSMSTNVGFFSSLQNFSADLVHRYVPALLEQEYVLKIQEYFLNNDKDLGFFYEEHDKRKVNSLMTKAGRISKEENSLLNQFLSKFMLQKNGQNTSDIDLELAIKVLPKKLTLTNLHKIDLINFTMMQKSLITFFHDDQDEMFSYYDSRLQTRLGTLKRKAAKNLDTLKTIYDMMQGVYHFMSWNEMVRAIKPTSGQDARDKIVEEPLDQADQIDEEVFKKIEQENLAQQKIYEQNKGKIKQAPIFAPPSFKQRINALELPMMADLIQDKINSRRINRSNTLNKYLSNMNPLRESQSKKKKLKRQATAHHGASGGTSQFHEANFVGSKGVSDKTPEKLRGNKQKEEEKKEGDFKAKKGGKKHKKQKNKDKDRDLLFDNTSKVSSDINQFHMSGIQDQSHTSLFSAKLGKSIKDMELSDQSEQEE